MIQIVYHSFSEFLLCFMQFRDYLISNGSHDLQIGNSEKIMYFNFFSWEKIENVICVCMCVYMILVRKVKWFSRLMYVFEYLMCMNHKYFMSQIFVFVLMIFLLMFCYVKNDLLSFLFHIRVYSYFMLQTTGTIFKCLVPALSHLTLFHISNTNVGI